MKIFFSDHESLNLDLYYFLFSSYVPYVIMYEILHWYEYEYVRVRVQHTTYDAVYERYIVCCQNRQSTYTLYFE